MTEIPQDVLEAAAQAADDRHLAFGEWEDVAQVVVDVVAPHILLGKVAEVKETNDHIIEGRDGYSAGFHYALHCIAPQEEEEEQHVPDAHATNAKELRAKFLRPQGACVVMSGEPFTRGYMAGYMNPEQTHYDIIATGTEEEMLQVAREANYGEVT